ncbi:restriction endonuclease [Streptomyces sp. NPDC005498]|uniref:restriction endonuclease n=1 Tax=Streptomyces sp. NPDC005498 TaxID=3364717 RepID=UPI00367FDABA
MTRLDQLHHRDFEHAVRDLMYRDGCTDAIQVGGAGDNGADVKATDPYGRRWVIQCKHRRAGVAGAERHRLPGPDWQHLPAREPPRHRHSHAWRGPGPCRSQAPIQQAAAHRPQGWSACTASGRHPPALPRHRTSAASGNVRPVDYLT